MENDIKFCTRVLLYVYFLLNLRRNKDFTYKIFFNVKINLIKELRLIMSCHVLYEVSHSQGTKEAYY